MAERPVGSHTEASRPNEDAIVFTLTACALRGLAGRGNTKRSKGKWAPCFFVGRESIIRADSMSNLVFISGDFCSGSTLLFTLFRETEEYHCLYEPLHSLLREYLIWPLRVYEHHFFVNDYFSEYKGFAKIGSLFNPRWADHQLFMSAKDEGDDLYRYLCYIIGTSFGRRSKVLLKFNRITFRLEWLRAKFPGAKIVHIFRDKKAEWNSIVKRAQQHLGREDVGQADVNFNGFSLASWCEDLKTQFPELHAANSRNGYDRFCKLWELSLAAHRRHADISIDYTELTHEFEPTCKRLFQTVECSADVATLKPLIIVPERQKSLTVSPAGLTAQVQDLIYRAGRRYASARVRLEDSWGKKEIGQGADRVEVAK